MFAGCKPTIATNVAATTTNTYTPAKIASTSTSTPQLPTASPARTSTPTLTLNPTIQLVSTLYQQTVDAKDVESQATEQAFEGFQKTFAGICDIPHYQTELSPSGNWLAQDCFPDRFQVIEKDNPIIWTINYEEIFKDYMQCAGAIRPIHWSRERNSLYFTDHYGCVDNDSWGNGNSLYRMNLETGLWKKMISGSFNYYSFSPDEQKLLYVTNDQAGPDQHLVVHMRNLPSGLETKFYLPAYETACCAVWRKDGLKVILTTRTGNVFEENQQFSTVMLDLKAGSSTTLFSEYNGGFVAQWSDDNILTLENRSTYPYENYYLIIVDHNYYDLNSRKFVTPTPTPQ